MENYNNNFYINNLSELVDYYDKFIKTHKSELPTFCISTYYYYIFFTENLIKSQKSHNIIPFDKGLSVVYKDKIKAIKKSLNTTFQPSVISEMIYSTPQIHVNYVLFQALIPNHFFDAVEKCIDFNNKSGFEKVNGNLNNYINNLTELYEECKRFNNIFYKSILESIKKASDYETI